MKKIDIHNIPAKKLKKIHIYLRAVIQLLYFLFLPSAFTAAFAGVKYIFTQIGAGEKIALTSFVSVLLALCLFTVLFGRFFCGFACAFGSLGDGVHAAYLRICKKIGKKPIKLKSSWTKKLSAMKYLILAVIALLCFGGVYGKARGTSPWDVFSMIHAGNFKLGSYVPGILILLLLIAGMAIQERFFCRFFCPMGAVFALLPVLPFFAMRRDRENCIRGCSGCQKKCPAELELSASGSLETSGECFQCQKCIDTCPKGNVHCGIKRYKGNEIIFTLVRAVLLLILFLWLGI